MTQTHLDNLLRRQKRYLLTDLLQVALVLAAVIPSTAGLL
jgi:hypothetical protein